METKPKEEYLPITKTDYGYVQKVTYVQPDLYHEEVVEIESPFASVIATGTQIYTFLLLGDQNAGKSTFIHAFTYQADPNYLELSTLLPILSSSFFNTRFLEPDSKIDPRDELPFLDTDIGRGTVLVTRDDFNFWVDENGLPVEDYPRDTRFIALQFIEIGGDHLDSMMNPNSVSPSLKDIVNRSLQLVHQAKKTIYFINLKTLLDVNGNEISLQKSAYEILISRLSFLSELFKEKHGILFSLSRVPLGQDLKINLTEVSKQVGFAVPASKSTEVTQQIVDLMQVLLMHEHHARKWSFDVVDVYSSSHLDTEQNLNVTSILGTLVKLLGNNMVHSKTEPEMIVARHVISCFKDSQARVNEADEFSLWLDEEVFHEYLEEGIDVPEVPETVMLQKLPIVAKRMEETNLALIHHGNNFSKFGILFDVNGTKYAWQSVTDGKQIVKKLELRLPYYGPLFNVIDSYFTKNIPAEFWMHKEPLKKSHDVELAKLLQDALLQLELEIDKKWHEMLDRIQDVNETSKVESDPRMIMWLLLLDEWLMGQRLMCVGEEIKTHEWKFSRHLHCTNPKEWDQVMQLFHITPLSTHSYDTETILISIGNAK
jgi:hypothetical protein